MDLQKVGRFYDFGAAEVPKSQKMIVAGNKIFRLSTLTDAVGSQCGDLGLHISRLQTTFPSVTLSKFKGLLPFGAVQANFHGIADNSLE